ncbi:MAG: pyridoxal phosphate-dependent aminotransferase [Anaerolineaceae bacterium]|nr:pyridoxal phosphate-dependent aminotransferase [Anaerolineaceae bacterium]
MQYNFDSPIDRLSSESIKWHYYDENVLPMWVADMDFRSPQPVIDALQQRVDHGVFGYAHDVPGLKDMILNWLSEHYNWQVQPEYLVYVPGVVPGFNMAAQSLTQPAGGLLIQTPVYMPFLEVPANAGMQMNSMELSRQPDGRYEIDFNAFEAAAADNTGMFLLCNPHNPVGRVYNRSELEHMAEICLRHKVIICSDEIHSDLIFSGQQHIPIASLDPEIAQNSITLLAPSKTFNIAGLGFSFAVIPNPHLRQAFEQARRGTAGWSNVLAMTAAHAAYQHGTPWLQAALEYMETNRDYLTEFVNTQLPGVHMMKPEGTYLAWLDCHEMQVSGNPQKFFLEEARVGLNDGETFGPGGERFVRLNFGCPQSLLKESLKRMRQALLKH